ncbi:hypothetical protein EVAR_57758_1 [Eumeta japonica]|uniref:Uncharacterized protein n=1 Tax=Eumeta variegata TaxID=151549 RepID=A0A4C1ZR22_EUMVA|nr:hypothetical protein EVAR_57758_1 [Eumeta japonica]
MSEGGNRRRQHGGRDQEDAGRHRQDGHPQQVGGLRKTLEIKPTTYAAAAAKPKLQAAAKPQVPGPKIAAAHTLIVSSRCANHTSDQVVKAIREVVDAREMGWGG